MGDFTNNGTKIGTCGKAYYATKEMLEKQLGDDDAKAYLNPANKCFFAFPFPRFDGKAIGNISVFHTEEHEEFVLEMAKAEKQSFHKPLVFHKNPAGGEGINLFCDCPYHSAERVSRNFDNTTLKFYLKYQTYFDGRLTIAGECIYCRELNIFDADEVLEMCQNIEKQASQYNKNGNVEKSIELLKIANRILNQ
jgi:hypothetical protein